MELGSYFLFLQEQIKDIIISIEPSIPPMALTNLRTDNSRVSCAGGAAMGKLKSLPS